MISFLELVVHQHPVFQIVLTPRLPKTRLINVWKQNWTLHRLALGEHNNINVLKAGFHGNRLTLGNHDLADQVEVELAVEHDAVELLLGALHEHAHIDNR